ncbi:probable cytochrome P450 9f2 isoform X3 [Ochlerotatus camptorhynchus]|uniref:probable cytochrome P450 9f2 isoform X3 n=1 Tax=Ochlerotatus camptorhynchus TaxID=644619 RepID=UPI0031D75702
MEVNLLYPLIVVAILVVIYRRVTKYFEYFHDKPIPSMATNPIYGSTGPLYRKQYSFSDFIKTVYDKYSGVKVFGLFDMTTKLFVIRDPELIKKVTITDFEYFVNRRQMVATNTNEDDGLLFSKTLLSLTDQKWHDMRAVLSPAFTGSKMRVMFELIEQYSARMVQILKEQANGTGYVDYEMKDCFSRVANDIIATCAFGLQVESLKSRENEFFVMGKKMLNFNSLTVLLRIFGFRLVPGLMAKLKIDLLDAKHVQYFSKIIKDAVQTRENHGIVRPDMIHLLMQARKGILKHQKDGAAANAGFATVEESDVGKSTTSKTITESEFIAQCLVFFLGGFDTVSSEMIFMAYELAMNRDVQQRLYEEIAETNRQLEGKPLTYDTLQKMKYMDMVVSESLRMWPAAAFDRTCVRDYVLDDGAGLKFTIDRGTCLWIPVHGIHRDPKYYPNPDKFDPERFSEENRAKINTALYLPFGSGPRNCIGSRFALMEMKAIMYALVLNFSFERNEKTLVPMRLARGFAGFTGEGGVHLRLKLRL